VETDGVVFVVAHNGECLAVVYHRLYHLKGFANFRTPIDIVSQENDFAAFWMTIGPSGFPVVEPVEKSAKRLRVAVDVSNDVVARF
jgi:hypothetical protein